MNQPRLFPPIKRGGDMERLPVEQRAAVVARQTAAVPPLLVRVTTVRPLNSTAVSLARRVCASSASKTN